MKLDYVLGLKIEDFLERRLQTQVGSWLKRLFSTFAMLSVLENILLSTQAAYSKFSFSFFDGFHKHHGNSNEEQINEYLLCFTQLTPFYSIGFQAGTCQVHPSRPSSDQAETHQSEETGMK